MDPEKPALTVFRGTGAAVPETLSYRELARRAGLRAAELAARLPVGERVVIALPTCVEFVELYLGCLLAGLVAVPAPPPVSTKTAAERVAAIAADCSPGLILTTADDREILAERLRTQGLALTVEQVERVGDAEQPPALPAGRQVDGDALAVLQYSSGSTGRPKGVMLDHRNVQVNVAGFNASAGLGAEDVFATWMPMHHDFGLFIQLSCALFAGAHAILMPPTVFARRPVQWFHMLHQFRVTATSAPNFAYDLSLRLISDEQLEGLDLSTLRFVSNGSEPIHAPTVDAFVERFARIGLRPETHTPAYGMAEVTVYVSSTPTGQRHNVLLADPVRLADPDRPELVVAADGGGRPIVGCGRVRMFDLRIVDPRTRQDLPAGAIGEIWLRGESVARGYWNKPELNAEIFRARLAEDGADGPGWLRTGDLGALVDGELFVIGRLKEMMIVRGRNLYPQDLEQEARSAHPSLARFVGAAFAVDAPDERIVLVHEVAPGIPAEELPAVTEAVARRITAAFGAPARNIVLVRRGQVNRTTSGKIQRGTMRQRFLAGRIDAVHAELEPEVRRLMATTDAR
ncbi:hypothetical protein AMK19_32420 [Kitasatospora sp. CB01950]|nr:hypothetical protein AMK19_32420 [Kitasatospora sp. CB01950]